MADRNAYTQPQVGPQGFSRTVKTLGGATALVTTDLAAARTTGLFVVPKGFVATGVYLALTDVDTNGVPTITVTLGDESDDDRYVTSSTIGQAGGSTTTLASTGLYYEFTADTEVFLKVGTAAATAAAGTATAYLTGFIK